MNKSETLKVLSGRLGITQKETERLYSSFVEILSEHLTNDTGFTIPNLGSFHAKVRAPYKSYNPHYKKMLLLPKKKVVHFTQSISVKEKLNGGEL